MPKMMRIIQANSKISLGVWILKMLRVFFRILLTMNFTAASFRILKIMERILKFKNLIFYIQLLENQFIINTSKMENLQSTRTNNNKKLERIPYNTRGLKEMMLEANLQVFKIINIY